MTYYNGNAIYNYIKENKLQNFEYQIGDIWQLVYGDKDSQPKLLMVVSAKKSEETLSVLSFKENQAYSRMLELSKSSGLPLLFMRFNKESTDLNEFYIFNQDGSWQQQSATEFKVLLSTYELPINFNVTDKSINSEISSNYQEWQRNNLGNNIKVIDLDLFKLDDNKKISAIYELKRSFIKIEIWKPFPNDFNNFKMLFNLGNACNIPVFIAYNEKPKFKEEDISKILVLQIIDATPSFSQRFYLNQNVFFE